MREKLSRILPNICIGNDESEKVLLDTYDKICNYAKIDEQRLGMLIVTLVVSD